jgi:hypothetical protein
MLKGPKGCATGDRGGEPVVRLLHCYATHISPLTYEMAPLAVVLSRRAISPGSKLFSQKNKNPYIIILLTGL